MAARLPKTLYHYCSLQTFYNIVKSRSFWLTDISKSNDSQELKWIKGKCKDYISKAWLEYAKAVIKKGDFGKNNFDRYYELQSNLDDFYDFDTERCWAFCLTERPDHLGQWRGYADDGKGIAIGFKSSYFNRLYKEGVVEDPLECNVSFDVIQYKEKEIEELFYETGKLSTINDQMNSDEVIGILKYSVVRALLLAPFYKSEKFSEEKEWRFVFSIYLSDLMNGVNPKTKFANRFPNKELGYDYIIRNQELVSHIVFTDDSLASNISDIWIGPKCKVSAIDVKLFLISEGFLKDFDDDSIKIHISQASYR